jgi:transcription elongation factor SPT6
MLAFVAGLGLRKADALRKNVRKKLTTVESRQDLFTKKLLGPVVWMNAVGFLKVTEPTSDTEFREKQHDRFDNTRVHPECYISNDFAPKICADALEKDCNTENYYSNTDEIIENSKRYEY